jgi:Putative zinc-finger
MTGNIFQMHSDPHRDVLAMLPWVVTGQLDAADTARVDAHLAVCADCRAALERERQLDCAIVQAPSTVDAGWADMRQRLDLDRPAATPFHTLVGGAKANNRASWLRWPTGWGLGAPLGFASLIAILLLSVQMPASFTALGNATPRATGNMVVIFRPDTSEAVFRETLRSSDARLVDGPTAANAYVLAVPAATRAIVLDRLRRAPQIILAEPVDAGRQP